MSQDGDPVSTHPQSYGIENVEAPWCVRFSVSSALQSGILW